MSTAIVPWEAAEPARIPAAVTDPAAIVGYAKQLTRRDTTQIVQAMSAGSFEMVCTFVWTRSMAGLKSQLASLGVEFIAEMLGRTDVESAGSIERLLTDFDAIRLAEDLGVVTATNAMRLRHLLETISHFAQREPEEDDDGEEISQTDAITCLRTCVQSILARPRSEIALEFSEFRRRLESSTMTESDEDVQKLLISPYFYQRTTLNVLLALVRTAQGAALEHALANTNVILPAIWSHLRKPEKWKAGQVYSELYNDGNRPAASGLKKALVRVQGFDYVPENLRSLTFIKAAKKVLEAHDAWENFYNEPAPMTQLASLGTSIPPPALQACLTATLAVRLGNMYGVSRAAQPAAQRVLEALSKDRWEYFLNECLPTDNRILYKLTDAKPSLQWISLAREFQLSAVKVGNPKVTKLLTTDKPQEIQATAAGLIKEMGYQT